MIEKTRRTFLSCYSKTSSQVYSIPMYSERTYEIYRMAYRYVPVHKPLHILIRSDQSKIFTATLALIKT